MRKRRLVDPIDLLVRGSDPRNVLKFLKAVSERLAATFPDSAKAVPAKASDRAGASVRGSFRRWLMDRAVREAAEEAGYAAVTGYTTPPSWSFPVIRLGAYKLTVGIVQRASASSQRRLRSKGKYLRNLARRNGVLNPQRSLWEADDPRVVPVIPDGSLGALFVVEPWAGVPDAPQFIGFWIPSPSLDRSYFRCSLEHLIGELRDRIAAEQRPARRQPTRKRPRLKKRPKLPPSE